jgi:hypothetical protein
MPKQRLTEEERRAKLAAAIAKIDQRAANRKAREASVRVRELERDLRVFRRYEQHHHDLTVAAMVERLFAQLDVERKAAS